MLRGPSSELSAPFFPVPRRVIHSKDSKESKKIEGSQIQFVLFWFKDFPSRLPSMLRVLRVSLSGAFFPVPRRVIHSKESKESKKIEGSQIQLVLFWFKDFPSRLPSI